MKRTLFFMDQQQATATLGSSRRERSFASAFRSSLRTLIPAPHESSAADEAVARSCLLLLALTDTNRGANVIDSDSGAGITPASKTLCLKTILVGGLIADLKISDLRSRVRRCRRLV